MAQDHASEADDGEPSCRRLDLIAEISANANLADNAADALEFAVNRIATFLGWEVGHAWRVRPDRRFASCYTWYIDDSPEIRMFADATEGMVFDPGAGLPARVSSGFHSVLVADLIEQQDFHRSTVAADAGLRTALLVPVMIGRRVCAVLEFYTRAGVAPDTEVIDLLDQIGIQLGRVIEREEAHTELEEFRTHQTHIMDTVTDGFVAMNRTGRITAWNQGAQQMFGWSAEEVIGRTVSETIVPPRLREVHNKRLRTILETGEVPDADRRAEAFSLHRDGHEFPVEVTRWIMQDSESTHLYAFMRDLTERRRFEQKLREGSRFDPLTHLANRDSLISHLSGLIERRGTTSGEVAVLFADIDQFRLINDSLGHGVGDEVLVAVATRFAAVIEETDFIARLAADEFVIVRDDVTSRRQVETLAESLLQSLSEPLQLVDDTVFVTASVGSAFPGPVCSGTVSSNAERLIHAANSAMSIARDTSSGYHEHSEDVRCDEAPTRRHIISELRSAFDQGEFRIHYQPQVDIVDGSMVGVEALLRWMHPDQGLLPPAAFMDALERSGLIIPVGRWVIEQVAQQARFWQDQLDPARPPLEVWVNVSTRQFAQSDLISTLADVLQDNDLRPEHIQFGIEVTESSLMNNPEQALTQLHELCDLGIGFAIDDFGTGYSSLAYLKHFPATTLKIDRSFTLSIAEADIDRSIVEGIVGLARSLNLQTVAEGVETEAQLQVLRELGVDVAQGYLFARPESAIAVTDRLGADAAVRRSSGVTATRQAQHPTVLPMRPTPTRSPVRPMVPVPVPAARPQGQRATMRGAADLP